MLQRRSHAGQSHVASEEGSQEKEREKASRRGSFLGRLALVAAASAVCTLIGFVAPKDVLPSHSRRSSLEDELFQKVSGSTSSTWPPLPAPRWKACPSTEGAVQSRGQGGRGYQHPDGTRYLMIQLAGGLNQMRAGICDAVVAARLMEAVLVLPLLDNSSWWADSSRFEDVFDAAHFISTLSADISIVPRVPENMEGVPPLVKKVPRGSAPEMFVSRGDSFFKKRSLVLLDHFDSRLADDVSADLQQLRCKANFQALRFSADVSRAAQALLRTLRGKEEREGPFVALHLRYEPDMLAFTGCDYGGTTQERQELVQLRGRWPNLGPLDPEGQRAKGLCVTSPQQVALALQSLGIPSTTPMYVASGDLWGGDKSLDPLKQAYPHVVVKHALKELLWQEGKGGDGWAEGGGDLTRVVGRVLSKPMLMAAVDYEVCRAADVFVANNRGNMAALLTGHRRYDGRMDTVKVFGSAVHLMLDKAGGGEAEWMGKLREKLLKSGGTVSKNKTSSSSSDSFYNFPRDCLCPLSPVSLT